MNKLFKGVVKLGVITAAGAAAYHYLVPTETKAAMAEKVSDKLEDLSLALAEFEDSRPDDDDDDDEDEDWEDLRSLLDDEDDEDDEDEDDEEDVRPELDRLVQDWIRLGINPEEHPTASLIVAVAGKVRAYAERKRDQLTAEELRTYMGQR